MVGGMLIKSNVVALYDKSYIINAYLISLWRWVCKGSNKDWKIDIQGWKGNRWNVCRF